MGRRVLVPLDGSSESEQVLPLVARELAADDHVVLLHVVRPFRLRGPVTDISAMTLEWERNERSRATEYLQGAAAKAGLDASRCTCVVSVGDSVAKGIVDGAVRENVDQIVMYTHDRKGLARLIRGSIAADVQRRAPIEVRVIRPRELATA